MKFAICNEVFGKEQSLADWKNICEYAASCGYSGIEVAPFTFASSVTDVSSVTRKEIKKIADESGLEICGLHWLLVSPPGLHINATNESKRRETTDYLLALVDFAGDVGARVMIFGSPKARFIEDSFWSAWDRTVDSYSKVLPKLEERNVILCQEALPLPDCDFIQTTAQAQQMVEAVNHPNFQLMLDVKSMSAEQSTPAELVREYGSRAMHLHFNDANMRAPGYGETDFPAIAQAVEDIGYEHWISLEPFDYYPDPKTLARESLQFLKTCFVG